MIIGACRADSIVYMEGMLKMMRKMMALLMSIALLMTALPAAAESIFPMLPTAPAQSAEEAPSYGALTGEDPMSETIMPDGSVQYVYSGVTQEDFNAFGVYLGEAGYTLPSYEYVGASGISAQVVKGTIVFDVLYDWESQLLTVSYPQGVKIAPKKLPDPFEGYVRFNFGQRVRLRDAAGKSLGEVTIDDFTIGGEITASGSYLLGTYRSFGQLNAWVEGTYRNASTQSVRLMELYDVQLHYVNADNHYTFDAYREIRCDQRSCDVGTLMADRIVYAQHQTPSMFDVLSGEWGARSCPSLESVEIGSGFDLPDYVLTAEDGILALTFTFAGVETPYVLYLREPGK